MKVILYIVVGLLLISLIAPAIFSQAQPQFRQEKLLNGLKLYMRPDPADNKVTLRVRVNSGAAFDPQGREGVMFMLARNLFPSQAAIDYFVEDLEGSFSLSCDHDMIELQVSGNRAEFLSLMETVAGAFTAPPIDRETTIRLKAEQSRMASDALADPRSVADATAMQRLYGAFPYGRPVVGTVESIDRIEYADLVDARVKFLNADNAVVTIEGGFDRNLGLRAAKRLFGGWSKGDRKIPSTFRQPEDPAKKIEMIESNDPKIGGIRFALRTVGRGSQDFASVMVLARIMNDRLRSRVPAAYRDDVEVRYEPSLLFGTLLVAFNIGGSDTEKTSQIDAIDLISRSINDPISEAEFTSARAAVEDDWAKRPKADAILDHETFKTASPESDKQAFTSLNFGRFTPAVARVAASPSVVVVLTRKTN